jgi:hypothetical protein
MTTADFLINQLWEEGFFKDGKKLGEVMILLKENKGVTFPNNSVSNYLTKSPNLTKTGKKGYYTYFQKNNPKTLEIERAKDTIFDHELVSKLEKNFSIELKDLNLNFGRSGNCTAFLLRKIIEKLIYIVLSKHNSIDKIKDASGQLYGLEKSIDILPSISIDGLPLMNAKTAANVKGAKFLGDTSAHNPLTDVDMNTIIQQLPYVVTAIKELSRCI